MTVHPSKLRLDALSLGADDPSAAAHLGECEQCAAHVARVQQTLPIPAWVRELGASRRRGSGKWSWLYRWVIGGVVAAPAVRQVWDTVFGLEGHKAAFPFGHPPNNLPHVASSKAGS